MSSLEIRSVISRMLVPFLLETKGVARKRIIDNSEFSDIAAVDVAREIDSMCAEGLIVKTEIADNSFYKLS